MSKKRRNTRLRRQRSFTGVKSTLPLDSVLLAFPRGEFPADIEVYIANVAQTGFTPVLAIEVDLPKDPAKQTPETVECLHIPLLKVAQHLNNDHIRISNHKKYKLDLEDDGKHDNIAYRRTFGGMLADAIARDHVEGVITNLPAEPETKSSINGIPAELMAYFDESLRELPRDVLLRYFVNHFKENYPTYTSASPAWFFDKLRLYCQRHGIYCDRRFKTLPVGGGKEAFLSFRKEDASCR